VVFVRTAKIGIKMKWKVINKLKSKFGELNAIHTFPYYPLWPEYHDKFLMTFLFRSDE